MKRPVFLLALILGLSGYAWGCAMIRATDGNAINVMENDLMVELCAKFTEPAAVAGVLTLFTEMTGEAISPDDYTNVNVDFDVPVGQTEDLCTNVTIATDNVFEDPELFLVDLDSDTVELCDVRQAFVHIFDSTILPVQFSQSEFVSPTEEGVMDVCIVIFPNDFIYTRAVTYSLLLLSEGATATLNGSTADFIFTPPAESINSAAIEIQCGQVSVVEDTVVEGDEFFDISLESDDSIVLQFGSARVIITDNDGASVSLAEPSAVVNEGSAGSTSVDFCISLISDLELDRDVILLASTVEGSAVPPSDYEEFVDVPLTIPAGSFPPFEVCSSVTVFGDTMQESEEMFAIEIVPENSNDEVVISVFTVTIQNDDIDGIGGDPHFSIILPTGQLICYSIQGEHGFTFNLITDELMQVNALFIPDAVRSEVTWIGALGIVVKGAKYKMLNDTKLRFVAREKKVYLSDRATLDAKGVEKIILADGKLTLVENMKRKRQVEVDVILEDVGLEFSVRFVKGTHLDMTWKKVQKQPHSHGLIGQFFRAGVEVDETRRLLLLPSMEPVPVMRKPVWHFMERDTPDEQLCWVTMNPGYQGKRLIEGSYLDYLVDDVLSSNFSFKNNSV